MSFFSIINHITNKANTTNDSTTLTILGDGEYPTNLTTTRTTGDDDPDKVFVLI